MGWFCLVCFLFIFLSSPLLIFSSEDLLTLGMSISGNQTMISAGGTFALGFFSPGNSTNHFLGIWYNKIAPQTVVWVANREVPLMNNSPGTFMLSDEGNLVVFHGNRKNVIWSSNVSSVVVPRNNSVGILTDYGNLILRDFQGTVLWESFNNPSDTILPGMKFGLNLKNGHNDRLISWNRGDDPTPGVFSFAMDPRGPVQLLIWKRSDIYSRTKPWDGTFTITYRENAHNYATYIQFNITDEGYYFGFSVSDNSLILRIVLDRDGKIKFISWQKDIEVWVESWSSKLAGCDLYGRCGPFGLCDENNPPSMCGCIKGFEPFSHKDWDMLNHSAGCVRKEKICENGDGFSKVENVKLPDYSISLSGNLSQKECENECLRNCSCTAYFYGSGGSGSTSSCLNWDGKLMDLSTFNTETQDIYIRLARAELVGTGKIRKTRHTFTIAAATVAVGILFVGCACYVLWRRMGRREANTSEINRMVYKTPGSPNKDTELFSFSLNSILAATNHFSMENKLGEGGFGPVFKGTLPDGEEIAIKRLSKLSGQGVEELMNELTLISKLQHMNLVRLVGCCIEREEKMLIYEYMPNKSLDTFLFDPTKQVNFDWNKRFHVIGGVAQGLLYLHKYSRVKIIHRDLKVSNILLDGAMNPKISDFGMARIFGGNQSQANTQKVAGTYGYMSPEYALNGLFSEKSDVFSFGVLLIEIVTGEKNSGFCPTTESLSLLEYAWQLWGEGRVAELMDASIRHSVFSLDEVAKCIHVGLLCVQEDANHRPTMSLVVSMLGNETVNMPAPQAPAFFTRIANTTVVASSSSKCSINEVSITDLHAR